MKKILLIVLVIILSVLFLDRKYSINRIDEIKIEGIGESTVSSVLSGTFEDISIDKIHSIKKRFKNANNIIYRDDMFFTTLYITCIVLNGVILWIVYSILWKDKQKTMNILNDLIKIRFKK